MRYRGLRVWTNYLHPFWAFGWEVYRHPRRFSSGKGPEFGLYVHLGPFRMHVSYSRPYSAEDVALIKSQLPATTIPRQPQP